MVLIIFINFTVKKIISFIFDLSQGTTLRNRSYCLSNENIKNINMKGVDKWKI